MLETKHLNIGYGKKCVQDDINLRANEGTLICLIGPNGVGKSTLLRTLAGLQSSLSGQILIQNQELATLNNAQRAKLLSLVLTDRIMVENLTIHDLVAMGRFPYTSWVGKLSSDDEKIVATALEQVNLLHKAHCFISEVSDGEKQRAVIAKALAQDTPLVLLDEPTAHLDLPNRIEIMLLLRRLSATTHKTFILSTHELELAIQIANHIWLMTEQGIEVGIPEDLMLTHKFQNAFGSQNFHFDEINGTCQIETATTNKSVKIEGEDIETAWLAHALKRCGIGISDKASTVVTATKGNFAINDEKFQNVEEVLTTLLK